MATSTTTTCEGTTVDPPAAPGVRPLVRKSLAEETLVIGWSEVSDTSQSVTVRWPQRHAFYVEDGRYSPMLFTESLRQALALLTHRAHHVPLDHRLGWEHIRASVDPAALPATSDAAIVTLLVTHSSVKVRRLGSVHLTSRIEALRSGMPVGTAELQYTTHPPRVYDRLRGPYADARQSFARALPLTPPVPAPRVGRSHERDVVLSPTGSPHQWQLRVDVGHRVLFDHPHDHVPGMVLLEAATQAAQAVTAHPVVTVEFDTTFFRFVEFDQPCLVTAEPGAPDGEGRARVKVSASQLGRTVFSSTLTTVPRHS